jgi:hypothetical protein
VRANFSLDSSYVAGQIVPSGSLAFVDHGAKGGGKVKN